MKGKVVSQGTYVDIECPVCEETQTEKDDFNPNDWGEDYFVGTVKFQCIHCGSDYEIEFEDY